MHYLLCTIAKDWCCSVHIGLALASIFPRIIKASAIRWSLTTTSLTSTEVQHNPSQALSIYLSACLDGDGCHRCTLKSSYDKVSASGATSIPRCNKNLTGHRMQINPYNNSFQEMSTCFRQKLTVWQRNISFVKKTLKMAYFCRHETGFPDFGRP